MWFVMKHGGDGDQFRCFDVAWCGTAKTVKADFFISFCSDLFRTELLQKLCVFLCESPELRRSGEAPHTQPV